jgi:hypothetical protein
VGVNSSLLDLPSRYPEVPAYRWPSTWLPSLALVLTLGLAAVGSCLGATALLMLAAAALALANWDLALLGRIPAAAMPGQNLTHLEKKHYQSLLLALGLALPGMFLGRLIHLQIPFGVMILLVILIIFSLTRLSTLFSD